MLSHRTAGALWGFGQTPATRLELTVIGRHVRELPRLRAYRVSAVDLRDHRRGLVLSAAGYRVFRVTWRQLTEEPVAVAVRLAQTLAGA